jgi:hypothetical protein
MPSKAGALNPDTEASGMGKLICGYPRYMAEYPSHVLIFLGMGRGWPRQICCANPSRLMSFHGVKQITQRVMLRWPGWKNLERSRVQRSRDEIKTLPEGCGVIAAGDEMRNSYAHMRESTESISASPSFFISFLRTSASWLIQSFRRPESTPSSANRRRD